MNNEENYFNHVCLREFWRDVTSHVTYKLTHLHTSRAINTPSVKQQRQRQSKAPIGMHCDAPLTLGDGGGGAMYFNGTNMPLPMTLPLDARCVYSLKPHQTNRRTSHFTIYIENNANTVADLRGAWGTPSPPGGPNSFNFMQFLGNFDKIVYCAPSFIGEWAPPPRKNPGSATVIGKEWIMKRIILN